MKTLILISLFALISCKETKKTEVKYIENPFNNTENEARLSDLADRVATLENSAQDSINSLSDLSSNLESLKDDQESDYNTILSMVSALQNEVNSVVARIVVLESQDTVTEYLNPCGVNNSNYDEILFKTKSGTVFAYFEHGNQRFLTKLIPNTLYRTTDKQECLFKISNSGQLQY